MTPLLRAISANRNGVSPEIGTRWRSGVNSNCQYRFVNTQTTAVLCASAVQSRNANVLRLLGTLRPVKTVKVELTGPDGIIYDSRRWKVVDCELVQVVDEIEQYIASCDARDEATIVARC
jgi:hypothetical protein